MATHSSFLTWRIPLIEDPGGLQSMGNKVLDMTEVTQHMCTHTHTHTHAHTHLSPGGRNGKHIFVSRWLGNFSHTKHARGTSNQIKNLHVTRIPEVSIVLSVNNHYSAFW